MEEASAYLALREKQAPVVAFGVSLCVLSLSPILFLTALASASGNIFPEETAEVAGVSIMLILVAAAVFLFVKCGIEKNKYAYLEKVEIETAYGVDGMAKEKRDVFEGGYSRNVAIGVVLCILSMVPLILSSAFTQSEAVETGMAGFIFVFVAAAVYLFVSAGIVKGSYDMLLQEGRYTVNRKMHAPAVRRIAAIYWLAATALYLAISLPNDSWETSWVLWPVAVVLFGVTMNITKMIIGAKD